MKTVQDILSEDMKQSFNKAIRQVFDEQYVTTFGMPDYYPKRKYGKWTIYKKDGSRVAWGLNEKEMKAYMKLLKEE
jgi:hypothetical protein